MAELLAEVLSHDTGAVLVAGLAGVVTRGIIVDMVGRAVLFQLNLAAMHGPQPMLLFLFAWWSAVMHMFLGWEVS